MMFFILPWLTKKQRCRLTNSFCYSEVEMHRHKNHQDSSPMASPNEIASKRHTNDKFISGQSDDNGVGDLHPHERMEYCDSEEKQPKRLNFSIDSIESTGDGKSSFRSISVIKDEDPSSVTSSGCSPPHLSHIDSPMNVRRSHEEEKKDISKNNSENNVKPEPSSTKENRNVESAHSDNRFLSIKSKKSSPIFDSPSNEHEESKYLP